MTNCPSDYSIHLMLTDPDYVWSHSRIGQFNSCRYGFYLKYILGLKEENRFMSQFGGYIHRIFEKYFNGELPAEKLYEYYICNFSKNVTAPAPNTKIFSSYFNSASEYFKNFNPKSFDTIVGVEKKYKFKIGDKKFTGIVDLITKSADGKYTLIDHKSKMLKPRSRRPKPTLSDIELDKFYKQLYLYSIPAQADGIKPDYLMFNCFRNSQQIKERFYPAKLEQLKGEVLDKINEIENNTDWKPNLESEFFCRNLCGFTEQCEYFQMCYGKG